MHEAFKNGSFVVKRSTIRFLFIAIGQGYEQLNNMLKGTEGVIVLKHDPESQINLPHYGLF